MASSVPREPGYYWLKHPQVGWMVVQVSATISGLFYRHFGKDWTAVTGMEHWGPEVEVDDDA